MSTVDRQAAVAMIRTALSGLNNAEGGAPDGSTGKLAPVLSATTTLAHGRSVNRPACRPTRAAVHDYLAGRLMPTRRRRLESHMDACAECTRAFIDVRETSWTLRRLSRDRVAGGQQLGRHRRSHRRRISQAC